MVKFVEASLLRNVGEHDRSIVHEAARRDRARLGIFNRGMPSTGGDSPARGRCFLLLGFLTVAGNGGKQNRKQDQISQDQEVTGRSWHDSIVSYSGSLCSPLMANSASAWGAPVPGCPPPTLMR